MLDLTKLTFKVLPSKDSPFGGRLVMATLPTFHHLVGAYESGQPEVIAYVKRKLARDIWKAVYGDLIHRLQRLRVEVVTSQVPLPARSDPRFVSALDGLDTLIGDYTAARDALPAEPEAAPVEGPSS